MFPPEAQCGVLRRAPLLIRPQTHCWWYSAGNVQNNSNS